MNFSWQTFLELGQKNYKNQAEYALKSLELLGYGSGRIVFSLSSTRALKMVRLKSQVETGIISSGLVQNQEEIKIYAKYPEISAKILKHSSSSLWLMIEKAKPFKNDKEFFEASNGISFLMLSFTLNLFNKNKNLSYEEFAKKAKQTITSYPHFALSYNSQEELEQGFDLMIKSKMFRKLLQAVEEFKMLGGDLMKLDSWGLGLESGRVVLLDTGLTEISFDVYRQENL